MRSIEARLQKLEAYRPRERVEVIFVHKGESKQEAMKRTKPAEGTRRLIFIIEPRVQHPD